MNSLVSIFALLFVSLAYSASNSVHDACRRLCESEKDCVRKCVGHAELMEVRAELVNTAAKFHKDPEVLMTALRSGANVETFELCATTGWSTEGKLTCLRSYPTRELIKSCKRLSTREEEQVRCVRNGKTAAEVDRCASILTDPGMRMECLDLEVTAMESGSCARSGAGSRERLECLRRADTKRTGRDRSPASLR